MTAQLTATITASHTEHRKDLPFTIEGWLNAETREQAKALGEVFPDFVSVTVDRRYRRLFFRAYSSDPMLSMLDQFLAACESNGVAVEWKIYNPDTYYSSRDEVARHIG